MDESSNILLDQVENEVKYDFTKKAHNYFVISIMLCWIVGCFVYFFSDFVESIFFSGLLLLLGLVAYLSSIISIVNFVKAARNKEEIIFLLITTLVGSSALFIILSLLLMINIYDLVSFYF